MCYETPKKYIFQYTFGDKFKHVGIDLSPEARLRFYDLSENISAILMTFIYYSFW